MKHIILSDLVAFCPSTLTNLHIHANAFSLRLAREMQRCTWHLPDFDLRTQFLHIACPSHFACRRWIPFIHWFLRLSILKYLGVRVLPKCKCTVKSKPSKWNSYKWNLHIVDSKFWWKIRKFRTCLTRTSFRQHTCTVYATLHCTSWFCSVSTLLWLCKTRHQTSAVRSLQQLRFVHQYFRTNRALHVYRIKFKYSNWIHFSGHSLLMSPKAW